MATLRKLYQGQIAAGSFAWQLAYTVPGGAVLVFREALYWTSALDYTVSVGLAVVPNGVAINNTHYVLDGLSVPAGDSRRLDFHTNLEAGDRLYVSADTGLVVSCILSGVTIP